MHYEEEEDNLRHSLFWLAYPVRYNSDKKNCVEQMERLVFFLTQLKQWSHEEDGHLMQKYGQH